MTTVQTANTVFNASPAFAFLSKPPPPRKKVPVAPLPELPQESASRRRSFSAIVAWASSVQPGSPGTPLSPRHRFSLSLSKPETSPGKPSFSISAKKDAAFFQSFEALSPLHKDFTPSAEDFPLNLSELGYTSVFVDLPKTPTTPAEFKSKSKADTKASVSSTPRRKSTMKRIRSLSFIRSRPRSGSLGATPLSPTDNRITSPVASPSVAESPKILSAAVVKRKKATYAQLKPSKSNVGPPPSLSQEIAIMQFVDGGSVEENIKKAMHSRAQAAGNKQAVGDVYRDGKGGIWADREEEMEYVHLLGAQADKNGDAKWVSFGGEVKNRKNSDDSGLALNILPIDRRGSAVSQDSACDPTNVVRPVEDDALIAVPSLNIVTPGSPLSSPSADETSAKPVPRLPLLNLPSRPNSGIHHHLSGRATYFHLDLHTFSVPMSPDSTVTPLSPDQRAALALAQIEAPPASASTENGEPRRRRIGKPTPLTLTTEEKGRPKKLKDVELEMEPVTAGVIYFEMVKREFLDDSFEPAVPPKASLAEDVVKQMPPVKEVQPLRVLRKSISMKFEGLLARK